MTSPSLISKVSVCPVTDSRVMLHTRTHQGTRHGPVLGAGYSSAKPASRNDPYMRAYPVFVGSSSSRESTVMMLPTKLSGGKRIALTWPPGIHLMVLPAHLFAISCRVPGFNTPTVSVLVIASYQRGVRRGVNTLRVPASAPPWSRAARTGRALRQQTQTQPGWLWSPTRTRDVAT